MVTKNINHRHRSLNLILDLYPLQCFGFKYPYMKEFHIRVVVLFSYSKIIHNLYRNNNVTLN